MAGFLIFDIESVPDGDLISRAKYPGKDLAPEEAINHAEQDARADTNRKSDFIPLTYHIPVAIGMARLDDNLWVKKLWVLNGTPEEMTNSFWTSFSREPVTLISFNGRTFDLPLLELMAFKYGIPIPIEYWGKYGHRYRYSDMHVDLMEFVGNYGAGKVAGGLDLLAKLLGRDGKKFDGDQKTDGKHVRQMYAEGKQLEINTYCLADVLDTYAVFLRTRIMLGRIDLSAEAALIKHSNKVKESVTWRRAGNIPPGT